MIHTSTHRVMVTGPCRMMISPPRQGNEAPYIQDVTYRLIVKASRHHTNLQYSLSQTLTAYVVLKFRQLTSYVILWGSNEISSTRVEDEMKKLAGCRKPRQFGGSRKIT